MATSTQLPPMLRHYLEMKAENPEALLVYRMGDFYEMFFEDAVTAAPVLEIALTARQKGTPSETPMCGIPHHTLEPYLGKLVAAGYKVAICDQMEDPAQAKGLVRREVTRVVTPGTLAEPGLLDGKVDNLLCAMVWEKAGTATGAGARGAGAFLDVSTGKFLVHRWASADDALEDLALLRPREIVTENGGPSGDLDRWIVANDICSTVLPEDERLSKGRVDRLLTDHFGTTSLRAFGLANGEPAARATAIALRYARATQHSDLAHVLDLRVEDDDRFMLLDEATVRNLDLVRNQRDGSRAATLLDLLDRTCTAMGARRLKEWLLRPLRDRRDIFARHDAVAELVAERRVRRRLGEALERIGDLERLVSRAVLGRLQPREAAALRDSLERAPSALECLGQARAEILCEVATADPATALAGRLTRTLEAEPAASLKAGGVIAAGVNAELDECRSLAHDSKKHILELEARERESTGIPNLKVGFNRVFGYYIEVTKAHQQRVPESYVRKQTLANAERYVTEEIKSLEEEILGAEERQVKLEEAEYGGLVDAIVADSALVQLLARSIATADVLASFADVAVRYGYCRPAVGHEGGAIVIREGRHPVVERSTDVEFVPNDTQLDEEAGIVVLTGPNMGGKSTYLRQVALASLMAQIGSFVAAESAELGLVDRIFTRVGASDDLARGESTFMVEMIETANILRYATRDSLVILDEVGRGTATFDGLSLAWAIVEHLHGTSRPKTVFATHYHELTELASVLPGVVNFTLAVKEWDDKIVFLRRVVPGRADKSYGIHVARLAGLPPEVLQRAAEVLGNLERQEYDVRGRPRLLEGDAAPDVEGPDQLALFAPLEELVASIIREVDLEQLSPLAALNLLASLRSRLDGDVA